MPECGFCVFVSMILVCVFSRGVFISRLGFLHWCGVVFLRAMRSVLHGTVHLGREHTGY